MDLSLAFWIIALVAIVFGAWGCRGGPWYGAWGVTFILVLMLGWSVFGAPIHR
jgi:hypothetical protein